jgi:hypothetical protein
VRVRCDERHLREEERGSVFGGPLQRLDLHAPSDASFVGHREVACELAFEARGIEARGAELEQRGVVPRAREREPELIGGEMQRRVEPLRLEREIERRRAHVVGVRGPWERYRCEGSERRESTPHGGPGRREAHSVPP